MNKATLCAIIYYVAAVFGLVNAVIDFRSSAVEFGILWICGALALLCAGTYYLIQSRKS